MIEQKISLFGFVSYMIHKLKLKNSFKNLKNLFSICVNFCRTLCFTFLALTLFIIVICLLLYFSALFFFKIGSLITLTNNCKLIQCVSSEHYEEYKKDITLNIFKSQNIHKCCSCNLTSQSYHYTNNINHDVFCKNDGYVEYVITGIFGTFLLSLLFCMSSLFFGILLFIIGQSYNFTFEHWKEYVKKKIDYENNIVDKSEFFKFSFNKKFENIETCEFENTKEQE